MTTRIKTIQVAALIAMIALNVITQTCSKILKEDVDE